MSGAIKLWPATPGVADPNEAAVLPKGGASGYVLAKTGAADFAVGWSAPSGGSAGQIDGGTPSSTYGGTTAINGGAP